jgi:hypothetical protein
MTTGDAEPPVTYNAILASKGKIMNDGVKILLERMQTHPEEFVPNNGSSKWGSLISAYKEFLESEDRQALSLGINKLLQQAFTEKVLEELVGLTEESNVKKLGNMFTQNRRKAALAAQIPAIPSMTLEQTEHLRAHLDALALGQTPIAGVTQTL